MNTGLADFPEESSEEPYSRGLTEYPVSSSSSSTPLASSRCHCVAIRDLPLQCNTKHSVGRVSVLPSALRAHPTTTTTLSRPFLSFLILCTLQYLAAYLSTCRPVCQPIDGIRPTATSSCAVEPTSSGKPKGRKHCNIGCQIAVARHHRHLDELNTTEHCASPEYLCCQCQKPLCTSQTILLQSTRPLARFIASPSTDALIDHRPSTPRPTNVATYIELPTLRPLISCY